MSLLYAASKDVLLFGSQSLPSAGVMKALRAPFILHLGGVKSLNMLEHWVPSLEPATAGLCSVPDPTHLIGQGSTPATGSREVREPGSGGVHCVQPRMPPVVPRTGGHLLSGGCCSLRWGPWMRLFLLPLATWGSVFTKQARLVVQEEGAGSKDFRTFVFGLWFL